MNRIWLISGLTVTSVMLTVWLNISKVEEKIPQQILNSRESVYLGVLLMLSLFLGMLLLACSFIEDGEENIGILQ